MKIRSSTQKKISHLQLNLSCIFCLHHHLISLLSSSRETASNVLFLSECYRFLLYCKLRGIMAKKKDPDFFCCLSVRQGFEHGACWEGKRIGIKSRLHAYKVQFAAHTRSSAIRWWWCHRELKKFFFFWLSHFMPILDRGNTTHFPKCNAPYFFATQRWESIWVIIRVVPKQKNKK